MLEMCSQTSQIPGLHFLSILYEWSPYTVWQNTLTAYVEDETPFCTVHLPKQTAFQKESMVKGSELEVEIHGREKIGLE